MRYVPRALLAGGLGLAAAFLTACGGSSGLLSTNENSALNGALNAASTDLLDGHCASAQKAIGSVETQVANLPGSINPTLVSDLSNGTQAVRSLAKQHCSGAVNTATHTSSTTATTPTVTHQHTTSTTTTSTPTTPSTPTPTTPTTPSTPATTTPTSGTTTGGGGGAPTGGTGNTGAGSTGAGNTGN